MSGISFSILSTLACSSSNTEGSSIVAFTTLLVIHCMASDITTGTILNVIKVLYNEV